VHAETFQGREDAAPDHGPGRRVGIRGSLAAGCSALIAAIARQQKVPVVSRDGHFDAVSGVERVGW
jgi:predicted nucleic acid-binding protein